MYIVIVENKKEDTGSPRVVRDRLGAGPLPIITIQEMLKGVNDSQGHPYFQDNGVAITELIYKGILFCCTLFSHFLLILYREWYNL